MKTIPPACPETEFGRKYWRGLDQLAETPEFRQWLEREFPQGASELTDPVSRRNFVKLMSASFLLAGVGLGASGCRRPVEKLEPFGKQPEDYVYGTARYYATAMPARGGAIPLVAKSYEGRPVKLEGNPHHPDSNGGTDRWTQAEILNLYDPDRTRHFYKNGITTSPEAAMDFLTELSKKAQGNGGKGLCFLIERNTSPSRARLQKTVSEKFPKARWFVHEAVDTDIHRRAATQAFGQPVQPRFKFDAAKVIVSLDCDFIGSEDDAHNHIRRFTQGRKIEKPTDSMNRLYVVEALMTLTGVNADHRLRLPASAVAQIASALASEITGTANALGLPADVNPKWITECAKDLLANKGASLVVAGHRQPLAVHLLAHAINAALGNVGQTIELLATSDLGEGALGDLASALTAGQVETLVILGANPAYTAAAELDWAKAQRKAKTVVRLGYYEDETFANCDLHLPLAHFLESWGDARSSDGTLVPVQPLIAPLFSGWTELEFLARFAGEAVTSSYEIVRATFSKMASGDFELEWRKFLYLGFLENSAAKPVEARFESSAVAQAASGLSAVAVGKDKLEVVFHRDYSVDDGRYNNNGWLQELPDPVTKLVWDNAVLVSRKTAGELGVKNDYVVEIKLGERSVKGPIFVQPGMADFTLGLALGYGRERSGRIGKGIGFNTYALRTSAAQNIAVGATVSKTDQTFELVSTQTHWSMEGRPIIREANLGQFRDHPDFATALNAEMPAGAAPLYPSPFDDLKKTGHHQWGMSIDLNSCVGCSACMVACQSENNVPIVGKDQVRRGRDMHWLRIDRYYSGDPAKEKFLETFNGDEKQQFEEWIDDVQVITQPMLCQHCESAPCENVCPVNATVHDQEGLNLMVYNRCVGTRYCSNNCPYKVRRFNYLDFNKRPLSELKGPFYNNALTHRTDGEWDLLRWWRDPNSGMRKDDEWDLLKMSKNPDVTVRMRGVMEKCTFCVQRIQQAEIAQKVKARDSGDVIVPDGAGSKDPAALKTACQQACPAGAIVFGNIADPESRVAKLKAQQRDYSVLDFLLTKPRTTYLAKVRNPNPQMPDYTESPLSLEEHIKKMGSPFEKHEGAEAAAPAAEKGAL